MDPILPSVEITGPNGQHIVFPLTKARVTIGRYPPPLNDIGLQPDEQHYVTREMHCILERQGSSWYVISNGRNPTQLHKRTEEQRREVQGQALLTDGDKLYIQGGLSAISEPLDWIILFVDPEGTQPTHSASYSPYLEYDEGGRLFRVEGETRHRITLRAQEDRLLQYMVRRNRQNHGIPVLIPVSELMRAIWDEEQEWVTHVPREIHKLAFDLRQKIEFDSQAPQFLINERKLGYRLNMRPLFW